MGPQAFGKQAIELPKARNSHGSFITNTTMLWIKGDSMVCNKGASFCLVVYRRKSP
jgi:hypothetical protein